jgi:hypothetical protein
MGAGVMIDGVLYDAIRELWTPVQIRAAYEAIFAAYHQRLTDVTVIVGKSTEGDSASGQVVIQRDDFREWLATLKAALDAADGGEVFSREVVDFSQRCVSY